MKIFFIYFFEHYKSPITTYCRRLRRKDRFSSDWLLMSRHTIQQESAQNQCFDWINEKFQKVNISISKIEHSYST